MKNSLTNLKSNLFDKIEFGIDCAFNEVFNELTRFRIVITKKNILEALEAADKALDVNLQENASKWFEYIAEELSRNQIVMESSHRIEEISKIIRAEQISFIVLDAIKSEVAKELRQSEYSKYTYESYLMIVDPSKLSSFFYALSFYPNLQHRINTIKTLLDNQKLCYRIVIQRRIEKMIEKIQNTYCNDT